MIDLDAVEPDTQIHGHPGARRSSITCAIADPNSRRS
jgi:hypothetical protein